MDEQNNTNIELTSDQTEKVLQFQDLTGIEDFDRCKQILSAHNWDLEIAVRFTLDGSIETHINTHSSAIESGLRHRSVNDNSHNINNIENPLSQNNNNNNNNNQSSADERLTLWTLTRRLISFPFAFIYDTILSIFRFALSIIRTDQIRNTIDTSGQDINRFIGEFELRYGTRHPVFYCGTYGQALNEAKRELKFLLVYLHSESHQNTPEFCNNIVTNEQFIEFISNRNLLFWSCSVTYPEGYRVSQSLRESTYPYLSLIGLKNNRMVIIRKFEGKQTLEVLLSDLRKSIEDNESSLIAARLEREERNMNQLIRQQQDEAFAESLRADQEKERKKQEEKHKKEAEDKAKREKELEANQKRERLLQLRVDLVEKIPEEPDIGDTNATKLVIKLPNGTRLERRFLKTQSIKYLYYFVFCNPQSPLNFQIRTNFPTRDLPGKPPSLQDIPFNKDIKDIVQCVEQVNDAPTFEECQLGKGAMLFVHDLEA